MKQLLQITNGHPRTGNKPKGKKHLLVSKNRSVFPRGHLYMQHLEIQMFSSIKLNTVNATVVEQWLRPLEIKN